MTLKLDKVVPWGRNFEEYVRMFNLTADDLNRTILGCADGPASFNAELTRTGGRIISVDPVYELAVDVIRTRIDETAADILSQVKAGGDSFLWTDFSSPEDLLKCRLDAMDIFCADLEQGRAAGRYITGTLPVLPFCDNSFDLALCSHFLFLYSDHFSFDFHIRSINELLRISSEIRIFPVVELNGRISRHIDQAVNHFNELGYCAVLETTAYEFQKGACRMLRIVR